MSIIARQRGLIGLILYGIAGLAVVAAIGVVIWRVDHWENAAFRDEHARAVKETARANAAEASIKAAQDRATAMALLWDKERLAREDDAKQRDTERAARFTPIFAASRALPPRVAGVLFPRPAVVVLDAAIAAGNASAPRPASEPNQATSTAPAATPDIDVGQVTQWGVAVAVLYAACADQVRGWIDFYAGLQRAQQ